MNQHWGMWKKWSHGAVLQFKQHFKCYCVNESNKKKPKNQSIAKEGYEIVAEFQVVLL